MLGHTKTHHTDKRSIKTKIKEDVSAFKIHYLKTGTEFANMIKTTQANLSSIENGNRPIGKRKAKLIAEKFDVDYRYFL